MKVLLINGSPKSNGNTAFALNSLAEAIKNKAEVESINAAQLNIKGCVNCDVCRSNGGKCVHKDDTNSTMDKILAADMIVFGSPVYWWGITAQLKVLVDKFYSIEPKLRKTPKKIGLITVGAAGLDDPQYRIISEQFKCIADFLSWSIVLDEAFSAAAHDDLQKNPAQLKTLCSSLNDLIG